MRRFLGLIVLGWVTLLSTNSEVLVGEEEPVSLQRISEHESRYLDSKEIYIEGIGKFRVRDPITPDQFAHLIRLATQFHCTYFTGRMFVSRQYPMNPTPRNVTTHACPNMLWFNTATGDPDESASWEVRSTHPIEPAWDDLKRSEGDESMFPELFGFWSKWMARPTGAGAQD
jgi:hypothetical protein